MTEPTPPDHNHKPKFDGTINIPTVLTVCLAMVSVATWSAEKFTALEGNSAQLRRDVDRLEQANAELRRDQVQKLDALRGEIRGELRDVGQKLDTLLMRGGASQ